MAISNVNACSAGDLPPNAYRPASGVLLFEADGQIYAVYEWSLRDDQRKGFVTSEHASSYDVLPLVEALEPCGEYVPPVEEFDMAAPPMPPID